MQHRKILSARCIQLIQYLEGSQTFFGEVTQEFLEEVLDTFRWHQPSIMDTSAYLAPKNAHPYVSDVIRFRRPHIDFFRPHMLDTKVAQAGIRKRDLQPKMRSRALILPRQTSFSH